MLVVVVVVVGDALMNGEHKHVSEVSAVPEKV
jgi:hypothetical protein